ncbi:hypothetical protein CJU90_1087 [Yarrowia sp. C11]|nr:hypothetical protein CKK34_2500 [Yarrowia sp. E02]KAG5373390.1 hypothetical protein CJU90_1087 [Yarrowia sp. C11]
MSPPRCTATTVKGEQCKNKSVVTVSSGHYCGVHGKVKAPTTGKYNRKILVDNKPNIEAKQGYIYVYSLCEGKNKGGRVNANPQIFNHEKDAFENLPSNLTLVKVGFTTKTPRKRLQEWSNQCQHAIELLPNGKYPIQKRNQETYDGSENGWLIYKEAKSPQAIENQVHNLLWQLFGKGHVVCDGCHKNIADAEVRTRTDNGMNRHVEWFCLDRRDMPVLYEIVGCLTNGGDPEELPSVMTRLKLKPKVKKKSGGCCCQ